LTTRKKLVKCREILQMDNDDDAKKRRRKREFGDQDMIDAQFRGYDEEEKEQTTENYTK
jgi:hypothetical protein